MRCESCAWMRRKMALAEALLAWEGWWGWEPEVGQRGGREKADSGVVMRKGHLGRCMCGLCMLGNQRGHGTGAVLYPRTAAGACRVVCARLRGVD